MRQNVDKICQVRDGKNEEGTGYTFNFLNKDEKEVGLNRLMV